MHDWIDVIAWKRRGEEEKAGNEPITRCQNPNYCCLFVWRGFKRGNQRSTDKSTPQPLFPWVPLSLMTALID